MIALRPSRLLAAGLALLHVGTLILAWSAGFPPFAAGALTVAVLLHGVWSVRRFALLKDPASVVALAIDDECRGSLLLRDGKIIRGQISDATLVTGRLVVIALRTGSTGRWGDKRSVALAPDMLDADVLRMLRVRLKWLRQAPESSHA